MLQMGILEVTAIEMLRKGSALLYFTLTLCAAPLCEKQEYSDSAGSSVFCPEGAMRGAAVNLNKVGSMPRRGAWVVPRHNFFPVK